MLGSALAAFSCGDSNPVEPRLVLIEPSVEPVLSVRSPGAEEIRYGFEGGRAFRQSDGYHLFTSEMVGDPIWVRMRLAHWSSANGISWKREATLFASSGSLDGTDPRASLWSPMPVFDAARQQWNLFYVAYSSMPSTPERFLLNHDGRIWRAVAKAGGEAGLGGPYQDIGVILEPGAASGEWEGLQGTDSFYPFLIDDRWYAFYGSAKTESLPIRSWQVGLASAPALEGPWSREPSLSPVPIEPVFIENPIVLQARKDLFLAVYDHSQPGAIGYSFSRDGKNWAPGRGLVLQGPEGWAKDVRTPLGLIPEAESSVFTLYFTGFENEPDWDRLLQGEGGDTACAVGKVRLRMVWEPAKPYGNAKGE